MRLHILPVERALLGLPLQEPFLSLSGRSSLSLRLRDDQGLIFAMGSRSRLGSIPWQVLEATLCFGRSSVPVRSRFPLHGEPESITDLFAMWSRSGREAPAAAAFLRQAGIAEVLKRQDGCHIRVIEESVAELPRWHELAKGLSEDQTEALRMAAKTASYYVIAGMELINGLAADDDFYPPAFQVLGAGIEQLLKLTWSLARLFNTGALPSKREVRRHAHNLVAIREDLLNECRGPGLYAHLLPTDATSEWENLMLDLVRGWPTAEDLLEVLGDFLGGRRFDYLDAALGHALAKEGRLDLFAGFIGDVAWAGYDPEYDGSLPELFNLALNGGYDAYLKELKLRILQPTADFVQSIAELCHYFSPLKDLWALSPLIFKRWDSDVPTRTELRRMPLRSRSSFDQALNNDRHKQRVKRAREEMLG